MRRSPITRATGTIAHDVTVAIPTSALEVAALQREAEADAPAIKAIAVVDADTYQFADALLSEVVRQKDAAIAMRKQATVPLYGVIRTIEGWFKPVVSLREAAEVHLKREIGSWRLQIDAAERAAREAAAVAAEVGDAPAMLEAINAATAAQAAPAAGRATARFAWAVKRIAVDLLPAEWLVPDVARIERVAREAPGDGEAPVIPGVVFERVALIGARR